MSWRRYFRRARWDAERAREIESYIETETADNLARGMPPEQARAAARRKFGNATSVREDIYGMNTFAPLDSLTRHLRHTLRMLRKNPGFTAVALLTLAIGIGANAAVFSVVNSVLLKPLPYPDSEKLVSVWHSAPGAAGLADITGGLRLSPSMYFTYTEQNRAFEHFGIWILGATAVTGSGDPEQLPALLVTDGVLQAFNAQPILGRWLGPADQVIGAPETVMLGYGYWQRKFGGDRDVIGRTIVVESRPREIVGVMPAGFRFADERGDLILPIRFDRSRQRLAGFGFRAVARLKPGTSIASASADVARMTPIWQESWPGNPRAYDTWRIAPDLRPLKDDVVGDTGAVLWVVMGTIGMVMLIACANVANLLLVRADARRQELAVRAALGAGWGRIVRELLFESTLLTVIGGALGLALAYGALRVLLAIGPENLPRLNEIALDLRSLGFAFAVALASGLLIGAIPAFRYAGPAAGALRSAGRGFSHSRERHRARNTLVIAETALALILLVCSGLMIRSFQLMRNVQPGFANPEQVQTMRIAIPASLVAEPERVAQMQKNIVDALAAIPGAAAVAFATAAPMEQIVPNWDAVHVEGQPESTELPPLRLFKSVSPGSFEATGTRLIGGRDYTWTDLEDRRRVVISENLARELWGGARAAVGKRIRASSGGGWREVIGVVEDVRDNGVHQPAPATVYWPAVTQNIYNAEQLSVARIVTFILRSPRAGTAPFLNEIQRAVWQVNSNLPLASVQTLDRIYRRSMAQTSFTLVMLAIAGGMALLLGVVGIYGVIAYAVSQRRREIGIRLALGAQPASLRGMFVRDALALAAMGAVIGLGAAAGLTRWMESLLFEVSPLDPSTFGVVVAVLLAAAAAASYLPARRAARVDPVETLRAE